MSGPCYQRPAACACGTGRAWLLNSAWLPFRGAACSEKCGNRGRVAIEAIRLSSAWQRLRVEDLELAEELEQQSALAIMRLMHQAEERSA